MDQNAIIAGVIIGTFIIIIGLVWCLRSTDDDLTTTRRQILRARERSRNIHEGFRDDWREGRRIRVGGIGVGGGGGGGGGYDDYAGGYGGYGGGYGGCGPIQPPGVYIRPGRDPIPIGGGIGGDIGNQFGNGNGMGHDDWVRMAGLGGRG